MPTFVWGDEFRTGIGAVDEQHQALVELFNRLSESLLGGELSAGVAQTAFVELTDYAAHHFAVEEALMQQSAIDPRHVAQHLALHDDFIDQLQSIWGARAALVNPAEVFLSFLTSWLCLHVLGVDQSLARQLALIGAGESPSRAFEADAGRAQDKSAEAMIKALRNTYQVVLRLSLELISANKMLEQRVAVRTAELERANDALIVANHKLEVYSQRDGLLRIANRDYFNSRLKCEWSRAIREQHPIGLLMIDVDFFKNYNDCYGHQAGDACLQSVARAVGKKIVRSGDLLARYGGEEFVVLLPNTAIEGAQKFAQGICRAVSALAIAHSASAVAERVTVSIGAAAIVPPRQSTADQLVAVADQALYAAKQQGRNRVCLAAPVGSAEKARADISPR